MSGKVLESPRNERTLFNPHSPYAIAKVFAHVRHVAFREAYGLHACNGIVFNHESPSRDGTFVTRKVTRRVAALLKGEQQHLYLGNPHAERDWGYAAQYVEAERDNPMPSIGSVAMGPSGARPSPVRFADMIRGRIVRALRQLYERTKVAYMHEAGFNVPARYRSSFVHLGGSAEVQYLYRHLVSSMDPESRILIVGVMGGRDYFLFKNLGFHVTALDLGPQPDIAPIVVANVEKPLPFDDGEFDVVLLGEVLEHLREDVQALLNVRRVLRDDGRLIVSLPFFNDWEEGHMRVHSPKSGARLLAMAGFTVLDFIERPAVLDPKWLNYPIHALSAASLMLRGRTIYRASTSAYGRFALAAGKQRGWRPLRRRSRHYGGYYVCAKNADQLDHIGLNIRLYTDPGDLRDPTDG